MKQLKHILFVMTLPPPVHGSSVMCQYIKESKLINETFDCDYINVSTSRKMDEIGNSNPIKIWRFVVALFIELWKLSTKQYDLCYLAITCHGFGFLKDAPFVLLCKLFGKKVVIHHHNKGMSKDVGKWPYRWLLPLCYKNAKVILLSWRLYSDIEKIVPKENVYICPNGIPEVDYEYKERNNDIPHLLFVSNMIESKGVLVLLDALKTIRRVGCPFICNIVGGETKEINRTRIEEEIKNRELKDHVVYNDRKYGNDKNVYYCQADVFLFPTYYSNETFGLVNLEAMQFGLPIVTTDEGGIPDVVVNGVNGLICKKRSHESLSDCILTLIESKSLRERFGKAGYELFKNKYTLPIFESRIRAILDDESF